jgi:hypothetical protein
MKPSKKQSRPNKILYCKPRVINIRVKSNVMIYLGIIFQANSKQELS